jgi:hypothetical protein
MGLREDGQEERGASRTPQSSPWGSRVLPSSEGLKPLEEAISASKVNQSVSALSSLLDTYGSAGKAFHFSDALFLHL